MLNLLNLEIVIQYDQINNTIAIKKNDFTPFEAFGIMEAAKQMISHDWIRKVAGDDE